MAHHASPGAHPRELLDKQFLRIVDIDPAADALAAGTLSEGNLKRCSEHAQKLYRDPDLVSALIEFSTTAGGTVIFAPNEDEIAAGDTFQFAICPSDKVYPICHEGVNRSQVAFLVLQGLMRVVGNHMHNVEKPHGAETGFDPHRGYTSVTAENYYEFTHGAMLGPEAPSEWQHRCFQLAFGFQKERRFGYEVGNRLPLNPTEDNMVRDDYSSVLRARQQMRDYFENKFYANNFKYLPARLKPNPANQPSPLDTRRVFVCFMRSVPIVMKRMLETKAKLGTDFSNVVILAVPWKDTITSACSQSNIDAARARGDVHANRDSVTVQAFRDLFARIAALIVMCRNDPLVAAGKLLPTAAPTPAAPVPARVPPAGPPPGHPRFQKHEAAGGGAAGPGRGAGAGAGGGGAAAGAAAGVVVVEGNPGGGGDGSHVASVVATPIHATPATPAVAVVDPVGAGSGRGDSSGAGAGAGAGSGGAGDGGSPGGNPGGGVAPAIVSTPAPAPATAPPSAPPAVVRVVRRGEKEIPPLDANPSGFKTT